MRSPSLPPSLNPNAPTPLPTIEPSESQICLELGAGGVDLSFVGTALAAEAPCRPRSLAYAERHEGARHCPNAPSAARAWPELTPRNRKSETLSQKAFSKLAKRGASRIELVRPRAVAGKLGAGGVPRMRTPSAPDLGETFGTARGRGGVLRPIFGLGGVVLPVKPAELLS